MSQCSLTQFPTAEPSVLAFNEQTQRSEAGEAASLCADPWHRLTLIKWTSTDEKQMV